MEYFRKGNDIILKREDLDLRQTLDCGQAFRWEEIPSAYEQTFTGYRGKMPLTVSQDHDRIIFHDTSEDDLRDIWAGYFDLETDYSALKDRFSEDEHLKRAIEFAPGIRILRQDPEETLISFIISQNNNIPRIKGIINRLCEIYGGFPEISEMGESDEDTLSPLRAGFRTKYLLDCVQKVNSGEVSTDSIYDMSLEEGSEYLKQIKGVGEKVAKCVLLFGYHKLDAYPIDVWIKRVNEQYYPHGLPGCIKGFEGAAQQYLFYYIRSNGVQNADR